MSMLEKHIAIVKEQIAFQETMVKKFSASRYRSALHVANRDRFAALLADLIDVDKKLDEAPQIIASSALQSQLALTPEDVQDLPPELLAELSISTADRVEFDIITLINEAGGVLTLDRLLIGLFKKTKEIHKRATLTSRLYRMGQKGLISNVPNKKGYYSTVPLAEDSPEAGQT